MSKRILYLTDYELRALQIKGKTLIEVQRFQLTNNGDTEFANYLGQDPKTPIYWLVETTQEEYQTQVVPHVQGWDRRNLIIQRKKRLFNNTPYTYGVVQGRDTQGAPSIQRQGPQKKLDRTLFTALTNPKFLQPWLNLIIAHKVPLVGIYSVALLSERLLKYLPKASATLLVTPTPQTSSHSSSGLRQSFFFKQKLQYSRLIPLETLTPQEYAEYVLRQIITIQHYLDSGRMLSRTEPLSVVILTEPPLLAAFKKLPDYDTTVLNLHILNSHKLAYQIGLQEKMNQKKEREVWYLSDLVAFQLSRRWYTTNHYATLADKSYFLYRRARQACYLLSILLLSGAATAGWMILDQTLVIQQRGQKKAEETTKRQIQLEHLREQVPANLPLEIELLRNVVDVGRRLKARRRSPHSILVKLSSVLNRHQDIFIQRIEWGIGDSPAEIFQTDFESLNMKNEENSDNEVNSLNNIDSAEHFLEGIRLHGKISPFKSYRTALDSFDQFVNDLRQQRSGFWKIDLIVSPTLPSILEGRTEQPAGLGKAPFLIDIFLKHRYSEETTN